MATPPAVTSAVEGSVERLTRSRGLSRGTAVGRYIVTEWVGEGGMGTVYAAYDPELDRKVALKLRRQGPSPAEHVLARAALSREARAQAKLAHPNVAAVYDVGTFEDRIFIAMEFVEGMTLRRWLEETHPDRRRILGVFLDAGRGLEAAHAAGLVHRDFKPENVLVGIDGRARVTDFGLARWRASETAEAPRAEPADPVVGSARSGTPAYMAPEQRRGQTDPRSDQYSFCVALYEALCLSLPPEQGDAAAARRERDATFEALPVRLRRDARAGPEQVGERYPSMGELLADLGHERRDKGKRGWLVALAASVAIASVGFGVRERIATAKVQACTGAADKLAGAWDVERKGAVARGLRATGVPFAEDAWRGVETALDVRARLDDRLGRTSAGATKLAASNPETIMDRSACGAWIGSCSIFVHCRRCFRVRTVRRWPRP